MNVEQAKAKLKGVANGTATKHPKVLIAELCSVVQFLMDELDRIKTPPIVSLQKRLPDDLDIHKYIKNPRVRPPWPNKPNMPDKPLPEKTPTIINPIKPFSKGNTGDAE